MDYFYSGEEDPPLCILNFTPYEMTSIHFKYLDSKNTNVAGCLNMNVSNEPVSKQAAWYQVENLSEFCISAFGLTTPP